MKATIITIALVLLTFGTNLSAQRHSSSDEFGNTLNIGLGVGGYGGYYGYNGTTSAAVNINYEFGVAKNFTLAPFISLYSYSDPNYNSYITPIGVKGTYYLNQLLHAGSNWDFYVAASLGADIETTTWDNGYTGDRSYYRAVDPLYLDFHLGSEYHLSRKVGLFLDLSTGMSTVGIAFHK